MSNKLQFVEVTSRSLTRVVRMLAGEVSVRAMGQPLWFSPAGHDSKQGDKLKKFVGHYMADQWSPVETSTYQDHVIAHVIGAVVLGYFVHDEAAHLLLDMGFVWTVYLDGQMGLLPQGVAISELSADPEFKSQVSRDVDQLQRDLDAIGLEQITSAPIACSITEVELYASTDRRRIVVKGEQAALVIETSTSTGAIEISTG